MAIFLKKQIFALKILFFNTLEVEKQDFVTIHFNAYCSVMAIVG